MINILEFWVSVTVFNGHPRNILEHLHLCDMITTSPGINDWTFGADMVTIEKFEIEPGPFVTQLKDKFYSILNIGWEKDKLYMYAMINDEKKDKVLSVFGIATGEPFLPTEDWHYLDSIDYRNEAWHIFYVLNWDWCSKYDN